MKIQFTSESPLFQDVQFPDAEPQKSWQWLTAADEQAERFEGLLRNSLVISLLCAMFLCALHVRTETCPTDSQQVALPTVHLPQMVEQSRAIVRAMLP